MPRSTRKKADEAVTYLYVTFPNFSATARKEPRKSLEAALACPIQGGFFAATTPPGHPTGEYSGRNLHSGVSTPGLPGGPSAFCNRQPPPSDRGGGLLPAGNCVSSEQLVVPPGNPSRFLSGTPGGLSVLPLD